ncbi:MAG: alpha/beta fold hydrolase [Caulobacterales bacterium]
MLAPGQSAPLIATPDAPIPAGAEAAWYYGAGGGRLRAALIPSKGLPRGSVVLSPGRTEAIEKYFEVAQDLAGRGFVVLAHDWRGQGLSLRPLPDRLRGHANGCGEFMTDFAALIATYEARLPRPWIALGHSMGGCLTALALARGEHRFAGAILSAPMFGLKTGNIPPPIAHALAAGLSALGSAGGYAQAPSTAVERFEDNIVTHERVRYDRAEAQLAACPHLALGPPTWGWLAFAFKATSELQDGAGAPRIAIPVVVVAAGDERLVDNAASRAVTARIPLGRYLEIPGAFHEILQETDDTRAVFWREFDSLAQRLV